MAGVLSELNFARPGFNRENTRYAEKGHWYDGNHVRFRDGTPQNIRGYERRGDVFDGTPRDTVTWVDFDSSRLIGFGTEKKLYIYEGGENYDITPIVSVVTATNGLNTTAGSTRIVVSVTGIGVEDGNYVAFTSQTTTVGGNIFLTTISDSYEVSVIDAASFAVDISVTAAATSASAGGDVTIHRLLPAGPSVSQPGYGWSAGTYGLSTYGTPRTTSNITVEIRQWSMTNWGEDLLANPRGGRIYQWDATGGAETRATLVTASPTQNNQILVTPDSQFAISLGCTNEAGDYDPLLVRWSSQENYNDWTASATNTAGSNPIGTGSKIVGGMHSRQAVMIWTDVATHTMQYVGGPFVFRFRHIGDNTGLIAPHAAAEFNGIPFWMSDTNFFVWMTSTGISATKSLPVLTRSSTRLRGCIRRLILWSVTGTSATTRWKTTGSTAPVSLPHGLTLVSSITSSQADRTAICTTMNRLAYTQQTVACYLPSSNQLLLKLILAIR
jgi:hypothetical protein